MELLTAYWPYIRAFLEILLIFLVVYPVLKYMHGTRGEGVLKGLIIIIILAFGGTYLLVRYLNLSTIKYILGELPGILLIGMLVIFQPEIRTGLIRLSRNPFMQVFNGKRTTLENEVMNAVKILAEQKVGALIAFEREVGLRHLAESGVEMDALLSRRLLVSIFQPRGALHDGGVIIRGDRIIAAACVFPLSESVSRTSSFGTRHRAGLGLSEESDALVLIVSEETGQISVAKSGVIYRDVQESDLKRFLSEAYLTDFQREGMV